MNFLFVRTAVLFDSGFHIYLFVDILMLVGKYDRIK